VLVTVAFHADPDMLSHLSSRGTPTRLGTPIFGKWTFASLPWLLAFSLAIVIAYLVPPMQSPDEVGHLHRAYLISRGQLFLQQGHALDAIASATPVSKGAGGMVDEGLIYFSNIHLEVVRQADKRFTGEERSAIDDLYWSGKRQYLDIPGAGYYFPAIYFPQAMGLAAGQFFDLGIAQSYYLARGLALLTCFAVLWMAFTKLAPNPMGIALLILPMSVFQMVSTTIDGIANALTVLVLSLFIKAVDRQQAPDGARSWTLAACLFVLVTSRTHLLPLLVLPFAVAWLQRSRRDAVLGAFLATATLAWTAFALHATGDSRVIRTHTTTELLLYYGLQPLNFLRVVFSSLTDESTFTFYQRSFIGILGWLDTLLPVLFYPVLWVGLGICAVLSVSIRSLQEDWPLRALLLTLSLGSVGLVFLALLVTWTPHPAVLIEGVQGRYFTGPVLIVAYALSGFGHGKGPVLMWAKRAAIAAFAAASLSAQLVTVIVRYH
jgi:uncharacterized membrane protein